jgi:hypothetical protein
MDHTISRTVQPPPTTCAACGRPAPPFVPCVDGPRCLECGVSRTPTEAVGLFGETMILDADQLVAEAVHYLGAAPVEAYLRQFRLPVALADQPRCIAGLVRQTVAAIETRAHLVTGPERVQ